MFNYCFVSGEVVSEPEIDCDGSDVVTVFELALIMGQLKAGVINILCCGRLAVAAAKQVHKGDRVAVMGCLVWYLSKNQERQGKEDPEIIAIDLEFVRNDSYVLGLVFRDAE